MVKGKVKPRAKATAKSERIGRLENILNHFQNFENAPPWPFFGATRIFDNAIFGSWVFYKRK